MRSTIRQLVFVAGSLWLVGCATQQPYDGQDALSPQERRMQSVEDKLAVVNRRLDAIDNNVQNSDVSSQVRELRGQIQELQHQQQKSKLTQQNFGQRLQRLESGGVMPPGSSSGASNTGVPAPASAAINDQTTNAPTGSAGSSAPMPAAVVPAGNNALAGNTNNADEQAAYIRSFNLLQAGKMDAAIAGFKGMLNQYPQGNYADNAWYWLGSAYYVKGDSSDALASFKSLLSRFPNSPKVPDALLKTGIIYQDAHKPNLARTAFQRVIDTYPDSNAATLTKQRMAKNSG